VKKLIVVIGLLLVLTSMSFAYKILCAFAVPSNYLTYWVNQLKTQPDMTTVDAWDMNTQGIPSLATLQTYDGVMTSSDNAYSDPTTWGDRLADYVDSGSKRSVILVTFAYGGIPNCGIKGKIAVTPYSPLTVADGQYSGSGATLNVAAPDIPGHPILSGVSSLTCTYYNTNRPLTACGVSVCKWTNGQMGIAFSKSKRVVGFTGYPGGTGSWWTGQYPLMIRNAFVWMFGNWTSVEPSSLGNIKALYN